MAEAYKVLIGGQWVTAPNRETMKVLNPSNGRVVGTVPKCGLEEVDAVVNAARDGSGHSAGSLA